MTTEALSLTLNTVDDVYVLTLSDVGVRGLPGPAGADGAPGTPLNPVGFGTWATIDALTPAVGDFWVLTAADMDAPLRPDGSAAAAGDGLLWDGDAWGNTGAVQGPAGADGHSPVLTWIADQIAIDGTATGPHLTGPAGTDGTDGASGEPGSPGADGVRGSKFLGAYATTGALPAIDGVNVMAGDYAYVSGTGELWVAA